MKLNDLNDKNKNVQMNPDETVPDMPQTNDYKKENQRGTAWREVISGGFTGILLGGTSVFLSGSRPSDDQPDQPKLNKPNGEEYEQVSEDTHVTVEGIPVAHVSDEMSFSEAFASARAEVGAGGIFEWRGGVYGTYYKDEWDAMTDEEKQEYASHINYGGNGNAGGQSGNTHTEQHDGPETDEEKPETKPDAPTGQEDLLDDDLEVLGVGEVQLADGSSVTVGQAIINGQDVYLIDDDDDGRFDIINGPAGTQQLENPISVSEFEGMNTTDNPQNSYLSDTDYQNDGNVEEFYD